jgi:hypothetical protein
MKSGGTARYRHVLKLGALRAAPRNPKSYNREPSFVVGRLGTAGQAPSPPRDKYSLPM